MEGQNLHFFSNLLVTEIIFGMKIATFHIIPGSNGEGTTNYLFFFFFLSILVKKNISLSEAIRNY